MKSLLALTFVLTAGIAAAGPTESAIVAAMKLSEQPSYSWRATVADDVQTYDIQGKTSRRVGWTWMRLPMVKSIAQRLGRDAEPDIEALFKSSDSFVIRTVNGWKTLGELPKKHRDWIDNEQEVWVIPRSMGPTWGMPGATGMPGAGGLVDPHDPFNMDPFPVILHRAPSRDESKPYSNAQFALARPHDELAIIVSSYEQLNVDGNTVTGTLTQLGAQLLLVREGQEHIQPGLAAGAFRLEIQNGVVTKYMLRLEGILFVDRKRVVVRQTSSTEISNVGSTALEIPYEARRKLQG